MDLKSSGKIIYESLKELGFKKTSRKNIFVCDRGYYLIVAERQPWYNAGVLFNIGVKFMWSDYFDISYDYSCGDIRIDAPGNPLGVVEFDSPEADAALHHVLSEAHIRAAEYMKMQSFAEFKSKIETRNDFPKQTDPDFDKSDVCLAIAKMFSDEMSEARCILELASRKNEIAGRLLKNSADPAMFRNDLLDIINNCRAAISPKYKLSLPPVSRIWDDI